MITPGLITVFYDAASMQRWNDYPRLVELTELDKQAHKFIIAYFLAAFEEDINYHNLIEAARHCDRYPPGRFSRSDARKTDSN